MTNSELQMAEKRGGLTWFVPKENKAGFKISLRQAFEHKLDYQDYDKKLSELIKVA